MWEGLQWGKISELLCCTCTFSRCKIPRCPGVGARTVGVAGRVLRPGGLGAPVLAVSLDGGSCERVDMQRLQV